MHKNRPKFRRRLAAFVAVLALIASACGSSAEVANGIEEPAVQENEAGEEVLADDDVDEEVDEEVDDDADEEVDEPDADEDEPADETDGQEEVDDLLPEVADGDVIIDVPEFDPTNVDPEYVATCQRFVELENFSSNSDATDDTFSIVAEGYQEVSELSPDPDLAEDLLELSSSIARTAEVLAADNGDYRNLSEEGLAALNALVTPELEAAAINVELTLEPICGIENGIAGHTLDETIALDGPGENNGSIDVGTYDLYEIDVPAGTALTVTMEDASESRVDSFLVVTDPDGESLANDEADVSDLGASDSQLVLDDAIGGIYMIQARSFQGNSTGDYTLTVEFG